MHKFTLVVACLALAGCAASTNTSRPAGRDAQASANALFNTTVISQIHKGQTRSEVRGIMKHDAEKHEIAGLTESWGYLTSYENKMITWITFTDHTVSSLTHEILQRD